MANGNGNGNGSNGYFTRVDQFNQLVRAIVVLAFTFGVTYGFVVSKVVSTETFAVIASVAFTWWFSKPRDEQAPNGAPSPTPGGVTP